MSGDSVSVWAKSPEKGDGMPVTLAKHTQDVLCSFHKLGLKPRLDPGLYELIQLAIVCHDWGKVLPAFQRRTLQNKTYQPKSPSIGIDHSLASILFINEEEVKEWLKSKCFFQDVETYHRILLSAVAYHHWRESFFDLISGAHERVVELVEELRAVKSTLEENLKGELTRIGGEKWKEFLGLNEAMVEGLSRGVPIAEYAPPPYQTYFLPKRLDIDGHRMKVWILLAGFLQRADHFASFCEEKGKEVGEENPEIMPVGLSAACEKVKEKVGNATPWQLEVVEKENNEDKNIILIAPTGYGKTEFAFLWGSKEKFFYTLPLRSAVNQIYLRANNIFGKEKVGLLHSDADVFLLGDGGEGQANMRAYDLAKQLAFPAIIATGDQFFPYALRPPGYEKIYATFSYARLIIDEVQAYDPRAAAIIVKFIEHIVWMGGKFLLMTATLPDFVQKELREVIGEQDFTEINLYEKERERFQKLFRHKLNIEQVNDKKQENKIDFSLPDPNLEEILQRALRGERVLVIANTVRQAQDIYKRLKEKVEKAEYQALREKLFLLHSRFSLNHRKKKEEALETEFKNPKPEHEKEGKILVATQVVEASLDIDADVLFTEVAPLDALVQRMGRVWRRYGPMRPPEKAPEEPNVIIWVYQHGMHSGGNRVYDRDLVLITLRILCDKAKGQNSEANEIRAWINKYLDENKRKAKNKAGDAIKKLLGELFSGGSSLSYQLCEYDKYEMVKKLYESLPEDGKYLRLFRETKEILDAGYMSERRAEAQEIFRSIHTMPVIPEGRKDSFLKKVSEFLQSEQIDYTHFKQEVLAEYVVQVFLSEALRRGLRKRKVGLWIRDLECEDHKKRRVERWCQDIYFVDVDYSEELGVEEKKDKRQGELEEEEEGLIIG